MGVFLNLGMDFTTALGALMVEVFRKRHHNKINAPGGFRLSGGNDENKMS